MNDTHHDVVLIVCGLLVLTCAVLTTRPNTDVEDAWRAEQRQHLGAISEQLVLQQWAVETLVKRPQCDHAVVEQYVYELAASVEVISNNCLCVPDKFRIQSGRLRPKDIRK